MGCAAAGDLNAWSASSSDHTSTASADLTPTSWPPVHAPPPPPTPLFHLSAHTHTRAGATSSQSAPRGVGTG